MSETLGKLKAHEIENLINHTQEGEIELKPDGNVIRLTAPELAAKNLRLAREECQLLQNHAKALREKLKSIVKQLNELLPDDDFVL